MPALVPLTLIWLGIGEGSKIALLWIGTFFQLVLLIADDARRVPKEFIETGRTLGAGDRALMKDVLFRPCCRTWSTACASRSAGAGPT